MKKGITPIISILVLVLVTVSLAGASWIFISSYFSGMASKKVEITGAACSGSLATIYLKNIGTDAININDCTGENNDYTCGDIALRVTQADDSGMPLPWGAKTLGPGQVVGLTSSCSGSCQYRIIQSYGTFPVQVQCSAPPPLTGGVQGGSLSLQFSEPTELKTIVLRSDTVTLTCVKTFDVPGSGAKYECSGMNITVLCTTQNKIEYTCSIVSLEIHNEVQVFGMQADSVPTAGKLVLNHVCDPGETTACGMDVGTCRKGTRACTANGTWGECEGSIGPQPETCSNSLDDDCDGVVNNGCPAPAEVAPNLTAFFTGTNTSATLVADASNYANSNYVESIGVWYKSPHHPNWYKWGDMYYDCKGQQHCHLELTIIALDGTGLYEFWVRAYSRNYTTYSSQYPYMTLYTTSYEPPFPCNDTDNGKNYSVKGTASGGNGIYTDYCFVGAGPVYYAENYTGRGVKEFYCGSPPKVAAGYVDGDNYICTNGCINGACIGIEAPPPNHTCSDSDGGLNYSVSGRTVGNHSLRGFVDHTDYCYSPTQLVEGYCSNDWMLTDLYVCPNGCINGTCLPGEPTCTPGWKCKSFYDKGYQFPNCEWTNEEYCPYGCSNGVCNEGEGCSDSDGGINYTLKGTANGQNGIYTDYCFVGAGPVYYAENYTGRGVKEFYCGSPPKVAAGYVDEDNHICVNGTTCQDGACILPPDTTPPNLSAYFTNITNSSAILVIDSFDLDTFVKSVGIWYNASPGHLGTWVAWGDMYYNCDNSSHYCRQTHVITPTSGISYTYRFDILAYNRDNYWAEFYPYVTFRN